MESTLAPGDSFVAILSLVAGDIEESNVVIFEAQVLHGGELTTHRVDVAIDTDSHIIENVETGNYYVLTEANCYRYNPPRNIPA